MMNDIPASLDPNFFVDRPDGRLSAFRKGNGPVLLLLHGWSLNRRMWFRQIDSFADRFTVIALDRRGAGQSTAHADLTRELEDIDAVLAAAHAESASIVGMSQGGRVGLRYAVTRPEKVTALVLQSAPLDGRSPPAAATDEIPVAYYRALLKSGQVEDLQSHWRAHRLMAAPEDDAPLQQMIGDMLHDSRWPEILSDVALTPFPKNIAEMLGKISTPVCAIAGEYDPDWLRRIAREIADGTACGSHSEIGGAFHFSNGSHAAIYNNIVGSFLSKR